MKVLVVHSRYRSAQPSGENAVVDDEATLLAEHGCRVERVELESDEIARWHAPKRALLPARVVWSTAGARLVAAAVGRARPDVVHFHNTFPLLSPAAIRAATRLDVPVAVTLHNFRPFCAAGDFLRDGSPCEDCLAARAPIAAIRHGCYRGSRLASVPMALMIAVHRGLGTWLEADRLICPSEFTRAKYLEAGWPASKLVVKHNTARPRLPLREGAGDGFVCISRLSAEKGVDVLLRAWQAGAPSRAARLTVIGTGEREGALRQLAAGVSGVEFTGRLAPEDAMARLRRARALVVPSLCYEVFPRTIVEAFALGVPVIASRVGALGELVKDGQTGLTVEPGEPAELAGALAALARDPARALVLGQRAHAEYRERFAPGPTTEALLGIYSELVAAPRARDGQSRIGERASALATP